MVAWLLELCWITPRYWAPVHSTELREAGGIAGKHRSHLLRLSPMISLSSLRTLAHPVITWSLAIGVLWLIRLRTQAAWYVDFHTWLDRHGVQAWVRNLDSDAIVLLAVVIIWSALRRFDSGPRRPILSDLGLVGGHGWIVRGLGIGALFGLPMLVFALVLALIQGTMPILSWSMLSGVIVAPFNEEVFYRGLLVFAVWRAKGVGFWPLAIVGALIFGFAHISWSTAGLASGWSTVLVTGAGGLWFAWLARAWAAHLGKPGLGNIWVPMALHGLMNLSWEFMAAGENAVGSLWPNVGRGLTIVCSTLLTAKYAGRRESA